ncbi:MAG: UDP-N-acetylmuramate dehydrogenase [Candidatus Roizmanbacteria bacterium]|nr:UDP-N-acetylmuramate dehydrogenase [Candidatus Roizmanbacteria bacterium]
MQIKNEKFDILVQRFGDRIEIDKDLSQYFTLKLHIIADYFFEAKSVEDWREIMSVVDEYDIPYLIIGGGSNIAIFQQRISRLVIQNRFVQKSVEQETEDYIDLKISSGYSMSRLVKETIELGYSGFEYHQGLPGTLGGAIYMNSKWTRPLSYVSDPLLIATVMDQDGATRKETREYFDFSYDYSVLQNTGEIFIDGVFRLMKHDVLDLRKRSEEALLYRKNTQPFGVSTGGCFFQNISEKEREKHNLPTGSAGYLIDSAGLKGKIIGGFQVSEKHANFIVNIGDGTHEDLSELINVVKRTVKEKFDVDLKEEVRII